MPPLSEIVRVLGPELARSAWVRRLARVSFLGALDAQPDAKRRYSRLDHSAAVARLGMAVADRARLSASAKRTFVAACLLHDVGHYPLSHSAEPGFAVALGADHHEVSRWIVVGAGRIGRKRSLHGALLAIGANPADVWHLIAGEPVRGVPSDVAATLSGRVNIDTFDGIWRVGRTFGLPVPRVRADAFEVRRSRVWIHREAISRVDDFWRWKGRVYRDVVNRPSNIVLEARLSEVARRATAEVFEGYETFDDEAFASWLIESEQPSTLLDRTRRLVNGAGDWGRLLKEYAINTGVRPSPVGLQPHSWAERYQQSKRMVHLETAPLAAPAAEVRP